MSRILANHLTQSVLVASLFVAGHVSMFGQTSGTPGTAIEAKPLAFDVVSIKPNQSATSQFRLVFAQDGVRIENASALMIIRAAYGMFNSLDNKFLGIPDWARTEKFDINAKVSAEDSDAFQKLDFDQRQLMVQAMLADRFKMRTHRESLVQPVYDLVIAKKGPKLQEAKPGDTSDPGGTMRRSNGEIDGKSVVISQLVTALTQAVGRTVVNKTALTGKYTFALVWAAEDAGGAMANDPEVGQSAASSTGPSIFTAIEEQLGLRLGYTRGLVEVLAIDHLERPTEN